VNLYSLWVVIKMWQHCSIFGSVGVEEKNSGSERDTIGIKCWFWRHYFNHVFQSL